MMAMRNSILPWVTLVAVAALSLGGCRKERTDEQVTEDNEPQDVMEVMTARTFRSTLHGDSCTWTLQFSSDTPERVGRMDSIRLVLPKVGEYTLRCTTYRDGQEHVTTTKLLATTSPRGAFSPYISRVLEYRPAPGQFVNKAPLWAAGDNAAAMARKATQRIAGREKGEHVSLGGYGGYIVFTFDHPVRNAREIYDFKLLGNAFNGSSEPGCIRVGVDWNGNGKPEKDEWYEIAGSEYYKPGCIKRYRIAYERDTVHPFIKASNPAIIDSAYIPWRDNQGKRGYVSRNLYHANSYWPKWVTDEVILFEGVRVPDNFRITIDKGGNARYFQESYPFGYVDSRPNHLDPGVKIEWAVNKDGDPVELAMIDFVMVYTGLNQYCGWLGETSTEIIGGMDLNTPE